jgi:prepilin-type N-terminal cleavage/methylation domain-containing protein
MTNSHRIRRPVLVVGQHGFTLIELLVVIAIIGILAALLFPALGSTMERGRRTACRNNLRQFGLAAIQFMDNNGGWYPYGGTATSKTPEQDIADNGFLDTPYRFHTVATRLNDQGLLAEPGVYVCPSDKVDGAAMQYKIRRASAISTVTSVFNSNEHISYMYVLGYNDRSAENPSIAPVLADESNQQEQGSSTPGNMPGFTEDDNHGIGFRNVLYFDNHVAYVEGTGTNNVGNSIFYPLVNTSVLLSID